MSFGSSMRFEVGNAHGKPAIFWDQGKQPKKSRKFGYKTKDLRHPIRDNPRESLEKEVVVHRHDNSKVPHQPLAERTEQQEPKPPKVRPEKDFIRRNRQQAGGKKKAETDGGKKGTDHPMANTVTLTQEQLNAILASVGKMASGKENALRISIDKENNEIQIANANGEEMKDSPRGGEKKDGVKEEGKKEETDEDGTIMSLLKETKNSSEEGRVGGRGRPHVAGRRERVPLKKARGEASEDKKEKDDEISKSSDKSKSDKDKESVRLDLQDTRQVDKTQENDEKSKEEDGQALFYESPRVVARHLTVAEKKRLQWARERAEIAQNYDPWGRPGAGAPLRDKTGHVMADYNNRKEDVDKSVDTETEKTKHNSDKQPNSSNSPKAKAKTEDRLVDEEKVCTHTKEEEKKKWLEELDKQREELRKKKQLSKERNKSGPDDTWADRFSTYKPTALPDQQLTSRTVNETRSSKMESSSAPDNETSRHAAIRSSLAIGNATPDDKKYSSTKDDEKRRWLEELERQVEEKRLRKMKEKDRDSGVLPDTWADRFTVDSVSKHTAQDNYRPAPPPPTAAVETQHETSGRVSSAPQPVSARDNIDSTHIRGQNVFIDPITRQEQEAKRRKYLEHQEALKYQIEEKERLKRLAHEKKMLEEMEEEAKMRREREALENQFNTEQQKIRQKEEARERQVRELKMAMDEAQERAQQEKLIRRMEHLRQGGHDISHLKAHLDAMSPRVHQVESVSVPGLNLRHSHESITGHQLPEISSRTVDIPNPVLGATHEAYTENRVLTPSRYRHPSKPPLPDPGSPRREFGTQTLENELKEYGEDLKREISEVEIEYKPTQKVKLPAPTKKVRVKSGVQEVKEEIKRGRKKEKFEKLRPGEKLKWNYQNPRLKRPVKQSERDPLYDRKRQQSEERRAKRAKELLALVELNKPIIPEDSGGPRSRDPSPGKDGLTPRSHRGRSLSQDKHDRVAKRQGDNSLSPSRNNERGRRRSPARHRTPSPSIPSHRSNQMLGHSPPVPALKHRREGGKGERAQILKVNDSDGFGNHYDTDQYNYSHYQAPDSHRRVQGHYQEPNPIDAPLDNGEFVPFTRTTEILDPSRAVEPIQLSRENTQIKRGRKAYTENHNPGNYGRHLENLRDRQEKNDPIMNPDLVKNHPTARQDMILQQLSTLKQSLMQRRREIETCMSPSDLEQ